MELEMVQSIPPIEVTAVRNLLHPFEIYATRSHSRLHPIWPLQNHLRHQCAIVPTPSIKTQNRARLSLANFALRLSIDPGKFINPLHLINFSQHILFNPDIFLDFSLLCLELLDFILELTGLYLVIMLLEKERTSLQLPILERFHHLTIS
jgi:hypothetical protein